jgi:adenosine kinase
MQGDAARVASIAPERVVDPTGCGDAYRAGILYALLEDLPLEQGARIGSLMGSLKIARPGPQSIDLSPDEIRSRFEREFGQPLG